MSAHVYTAPCVNTHAVEEYIKKCVAINTFPKCIQIHKGDEPMLRMCFAPHSYDERMQVYSLSKSFTSIACGICMDEGLLTPDTKICELFADKIPDNPHPYILQMRLCDLLSMQSGHGCCALPLMRNSEDSLKTFFEQPLPHEPGKTFVYSTGATCLCGAAVERVTGKKLVDFLYERLFSVLGIERPLWLETHDGQTLSGTGLHISSNDLTKFALFLKNKGVWNGRRIVSEEYIKQATSFHSVDPNNGSPDWVAGYGWQFWLNARGGFRGDGAFGQLCLVMPDETTITFLGESGNMHDEVRLIYGLLDTMYLPEEGEKADLEGLVASHYSLARSDKGELDFCVSVEENPTEISEISFTGDEILHVVMETAYGKKEIACGNGFYIGNHLMLRYLSVSINQFDSRFGSVEPISVYACYTFENDKLCVVLRHIDTPHVQKWTFDTEKGEWNIHSITGELKCKSFKIHLKENDSSDK